MTSMRKLLPKLLPMVVLLVLLAACGRDKAAETTPESVTPASAAPAAASTTAATEVIPATEAAPPTAAAPASSDAATAAPASSDAPAASDALAAASDGDALSVVQNAMRAQLAGGPYRATTTIESEGTVTEMVAEVIPPDQMHITIGGGNMEMILLNNTLWSKTAGSPWVQMGSPDTMQSIFDAMRGQVDAANLINVQQVGAEPVLGIATNVYSFQSSMGEGSGLITSEVKLWVAKDSGLPVRMESSSVAGGATTTAIQTIEYDNSITIEAPTP